MRAPQETTKEQVQVAVASSYQLQMSVRDIDLNGCLVRISEGSLEEEAGVVVWDASLVLVQYLGLLVKQSGGTGTAGRLSWLSPCF